MATWGEAPGARKVDEAGSRPEVYLSSQLRTECLIEADCREACDRCRRLECNKSKPANSAITHIPCIHLMSLSRGIRYKQSTHTFLSRLSKEAAAGTHNDGLESTPAPYEKAQSI